MIGASGSPLRLDCYRKISNHASIDVLLLMIKVPWGRKALHFSAFEARALTSVACGEIC
jgi:hypothetical protein